MNLSNTFWKNSPKPWNFFHEYTQKYSLGYASSIFWILVFTGIVASQPISLIIIICWVGIYSIHTYVLLSKYIISSYPESKYFFIDVVFCSMVYKQKKTPIWSIISEIKKRAITDSPEDFKKYVETLYQKHIDWKSPIPADTTSTPKEISSIDPEKIPPSVIQEPPKKTWESQTADTSRWTSKSIWDNYESVLDTMKK